MRTTSLLVLSLAALTSTPTHGDAQSAYDVPTAFLELWKESYQVSVDEYVVELMDAFGESDDIAGSEKPLILERAESYLRTQLAWESRGVSVVRESLISRCGVPLLVTLTPVFEHEIKWEDAPQDAREAWVRCWIDVDFDVGVSVPGLLMERDKVEAFQKIIEAPSRQRL